MSYPSLSISVDWADAGAFTDAIAPCPGTVLEYHSDRGRAADFSTDAIGSATFRLSNDDHRYTAERNWCDNPSFEGSMATSGWSILATGLTAAATSIATAVDNAPSAGSACGQAVLPAVANAGVSYALPWIFRNGKTYSLSVYLRSAAGSLNVEVGIGSSGTPADYAKNAGPITADWAAYALTWTPSADRSDAVIFVRTTAAAATVKIDRVQLNAGATANTYLEAPTKGQLTPGRPVLATATYSGVTYPLFYGRLERVSPNPDLSVTIVAYDPFRAMQGAPCAFPAIVGRSQRDYRLAVLDEFARGSVNYVLNPSFETDTTGWSASPYVSVGAGGYVSTIARVATDHAPEAGGGACLDVTPSGGNPTGVGYHLWALNQVASGVPIHAALYAKLVAGTATGWELRLGQANGGATTYAARTGITLTTSWQRIDVTWVPSATTWVTETNGQAALALVNATVDAAIHILIDGVTVTRGRALWPYSDAGVGRLPNYCVRSGFELGSTTDWDHGTKNLCGNGNFEVDTTGWSTATDGLVTVAGASVARITTVYAVGAACAQVSGTGAIGRGVRYAVAGTFKSGTPYCLTGYLRCQANPQSLDFGVGSSGTPADKAKITLSPATTGWNRVSVYWTPSSDRADAHIYCIQNTTAATTWTLDGITLSPCAALWTSGTLSTDPLYYDVGLPVTEVASFTATAAAAKFGTYGLRIVSLAAAGSGVVHTLRAARARVVAGQPYTLSMYVRSGGGGTAWKIGIGNNPTPADKAETTFTADGTWQQVSVTWTPAALAESHVSQFLAYVCTNGALASTLDIDGVRLEVGSSASAYELAEWAGAGNGNESDAALGACGDTAAPGSGANCQSELRAVNDSIGGWHYVAPLAASPFWKYVSVPRSVQTALTLAEAYDAIEDVTPPEQDITAVQNVVAVSEVSASNADSCDRYGARYQGYSASAYTASVAARQALADDLADRYRWPPRRPIATLHNAFVRILSRELGDLVELPALPRFLEPAIAYTILRIQLDVTRGGTDWVARQTLEEYLY